MPSKTQNQRIDSGMCHGGPRLLAALDGDSNVATLSPLLRPREIVVFLSHIFVCESEAEVEGYFPNLVARKPQAISALDSAA